MAGDEVQLITISGNPNGGDYLLGFDGEMVNPALKYNANDAAMTSALCALSTVGVGNLIVVKRSSGQLYDVSFQAALGQRDVPLLDVDYSGLNRGSVTVEVVTEGWADSPVSSMLAEQLTAQEETNAAAHAVLVEEQLAAITEKRAAMDGVPPEKRPL